MALVRESDSFDAGPSSLLRTALPFVLNMSASVALIAVNKALMSTYGFVWAVTLCGLHFTTTAVVGRLGKRREEQQAVCIPLPELALFVVAANSSVAALNISLKLNSVGLYQIAKISLIPVTCALERVVFGRRVTWATFLSILCVVFGVGLCVVSDVSVTSPGLLAAAVAVLTTCGQQVGVSALLKRHAIASGDLVNYVFPWQAGALMLLGPLLDKMLVGSFPHTWAPPGGESSIAVIYLLLSCCLAVGVNYSQFKCLSVMSPTGFQVLGHLKTLLILVLGWVYFGEPFFFRTAAGVFLAVSGMILYGRFSSPPAKASSESK